LLLGETDRALHLAARFAACFTDARTPELVEHQVSTIYSAHARIRKSVGAMMRKLSVT